MEGVVQCAPAVPVRATRNDSLRAQRASVWLAIAIVCLLSSWYFAAVIAPVALGSNAPTVWRGLFPEWFGTREILLQGRDPYSPQSTREIQIAVYGKAAAAGGEARNQHRFAYPVFFAFLFFSLAVLPFWAAQLLALAGCMVATAASPGLWLRHRSFGLAGPICVFVFASYPVVLGLQLRQPTLMVAATLAAAYYCVRSERLGLAGILAALSTCKPQLAIAVLLPLSIWSIAQWGARKRFLLAAAGGLGGLLLASELVSRGWITHWMWTLKAYAHYAGSAPPLADLLPGRLVVPGAIILLAAVVGVGCKYRDQDLLYAVSFSIAAFQLLFPFQIYNEVLVLPAALWLANHAGEIKFRGQLHALLYYCTWIVLGVGWAATIGLSLANLLAPGAGLTLWQLPLLTAWLYPPAVFATLALCALPAWNRFPARTRVLGQ